MVSNEILTLLEKRFATKSFDTSKKVSKEEITIILESGRLSPSSFGLEPWKFLVVENQELKDKLQEVSFNQTQVGQSSAVIVFLTKKYAFETTSDYVKTLFDKRMPEEISNQMQEVVGNFLSYKTQEQKEAWMKAQNYLACQSMMITAASLNVDSCPMEGFTEDKVLDILKLSANEYGVALLLPLGYKTQDARKKQRLSFEEVVEFR